MAVAEIPRRVVMVMWLFSWSFLSRDSSVVVRRIPRDLPTLFKIGGNPADSCRTRVR
jgi:hypothetical protein